MPPIRCQDSMASDHEERSPFDISRQFLRLRIWLAFSVQILHGDGDETRRSRGRLSARQRRPWPKKTTTERSPNITEALKLQPKEAQVSRHVGRGLVGERRLSSKAWPRSRRPSKCIRTTRARTTSRRRTSRFRPRRWSTAASRCERCSPTVRRWRNTPRRPSFCAIWAARKFAGEDLGSLIDWDPEPPTDSDAEHTAPDENDHGSIQVHPNYTHGRRAGRPRSFEELWAGAIYELHNINNAKHFVELHEQAAEGKVTKEEFVGGIVKHEVVAAQQTRAFYLKVFLPFAAKQKLDHAAVALVRRLVGPARRGAKRLHQQVGLSLAALRPAVRLAHGRTAFPAGRVRQGDRIARRRCATKPTARTIMPTSISGSAAAA